MLKCNNCGSTDFIVGKALLCDPPKYEYICKNCRKIILLDSNDICENTYNDKEDKNNNFISVKGNIINLNKLSYTVIKSIRTANETEYYVRFSFNSNHFIEIICEDIEEAHNILNNIQKELNIININGGK